MINKLKGGVIIIGSLLWDNDFRTIWREKSLENLDAKIQVNIKIRYGRSSDGANRKGTYTMVFCNHPLTKKGQGYIVKLKDDIDEGRFAEEALALAKAEGIAKAHERFLSKPWGSVGILVNEKKTEALTVKELWNALFEKSKHIKFNHLDFRVENSMPVIDQNGYLHIDMEWKDEIDDFDFFFATPTVPQPKDIYTQPTEIAAKIIECDYYQYFKENLKSNIKTYQDKDILNCLLDKGYNLVKNETR